MTPNTKFEFDLGVRIQLVSALRAGLEPDARTGAVILGVAYTASARMEPAFVLQAGMASIVLWKAAPNHAPLMDFARLIW